MRKVIANREVIAGYFANEKNYEKLRSLCIMIYRDHNTAEDALHDIYIKLIKNAERIDFPDHAAEVLPYMHEVIRNHRFDGFKKRKDTPEPMEEYESLPAEEDESAGDAVNPEDVNMYMQNHRGSFTEKENTLWNCIYTMRNMHDKEQALGKTSNNLYVMRHRLLAKIHRLTEKHGLI